MTTLKHLVALAKKWREDDGTNGPSDYSHENRILLGQCAAELKSALALLEQEPIAEVRESNNGTLIAAKLMQAASLPVGTTLYTSPHPEAASVPVKVLEAYLKEYQYHMSVEAGESLETLLSRHKESPHE